MEVIWSRPAKETLASIVEYVEDSFNSTVALKVYNKINDHSIKTLFKWYLHPKSKKIYCN